MKSYFRTINQMKLQPIMLKKKVLKSNNVKYHEQLYLVTKSTYKPKLISLKFKS
jgi:hypothetical protein